jgi:hypothetical protein
MTARGGADETFKGFILRKGDDGLITIIDATGRPLSEDMKFAKSDAGRAFVDQWVATRSWKKNDE